MTRLPAPARTALLRISATLLALAGLFCMSPALAVDQREAAAPAWRLVSEKEGIKVFTAYREGARLKTFRGVMTIPVSDWNAIAGVINDYANAPRWLHFVSSVQEIGRRGSLDRDLIFQIDLPWPVNDREALVHAHGWNPPGTWDTVILFANAPTLLPPNGDFVRFPELNARLEFHWAGGNRMEITYELVADPGGNIPEWLVNVVLTDAPYVTLKRFAKAITRPEYQGRYYDYIVTPPGFGARTK